MQIQNSGNFETLTLLVMACTLIFGPRRTNMKSKATIYIIFAILTEKTENNHRSIFVIVDYTEKVVRNEQIFIDIAGWINFFENLTKLFFTEMFP